MSELVTLSKGNPGFEDYLLGTFSKTKRALPLQTLNANSASETVTFKIVDVNELEKPHLLSRIAQTFKVRSFLLVLVPLLLVLTKNIADQTLEDPWLTILATFGVTLAFIAVNFRNDFMDHMHGVDRVMIRSGSRAIQRGWTTAAQVRTWANVFVFLSLLCALPVMIVVPQVAVLTVLALMVGLWAQFKKRKSFKDHVGGEFALFLLLGPMLTTGYQLSMAASFDVEIMWLGALWGWLVTFVVHLKNFKNILPSSQAGFTNTVNWLGFDKSRRLLAGWWLAFVFFNLIFHLEYAGIYWGWYLTAILLFISFPFIHRLRRASSPVGSELMVAFRSGFNLFVIAVGLWVFECLWYLFQ